MTGYVSHETVAHSRAWFFLVTNKFQSFCGGDGSFTTLLWRWWLQFYNIVVVVVAVLQYCFGGGCSLTTLLWLWWLQFYNFIVVVVVAVLQLCCGGGSFTTSLW